MKEVMRKAGVSKGVELDRIMFDLNSMARGDGTGTQIEIFLGRAVNTTLPNHGGNFLIIMRDIEGRKKVQ